jgi:hypothetical protein
MLQEASFAVFVQRSENERLVSFRKVFVKEDSGRTSKRKKGFLRTLDIQVEPAVSTYVSTRKSYYVSRKITVSVEKDNNPQILQELVQPYLHASHLITGHTSQIW